jgi:hypothetical protein
LLILEINLRQQQKKCKCGEIQLASYHNEGGAAFAGLQVGLWKRQYNNFAD